MFLCAVMDGNKVCVKNVFLNKVQSVIKYQFASLSRPDGRLGLIASVFQSFCSGFVSINIDHMTTFFFLVFHYCPKFRTVDKKLSPFS